MEFTLYLHVPIQESKGSLTIMIFHVLGGTERGHELRGETKLSTKGTLCQVSHTAGEKLRVVGKSSRKPQPEDFPGSGNQAEVCWRSLLGFLLSLLCYLDQAVTLG